MDVKPFIKRRIARLREQMAGRGLDAVIVEKPENAFYFSNFNPVLNSHPAFVLVPLEGDPVLLVHCIRCDHAKTEGALENVQLYGKWGANVALAADPVEAMALVLGDKPLKLGLELDFMAAAKYRKICERFGVEQAENVSDLLNKMKLFKDDYEIACIRRSARLVDTGVETAIDCLAKGYSEAAASTEGQYAMRKLWHRDYPDSEVCGFGTSEGGMIDSLHVWCLTNEHIAYGCDCPKHGIPAVGDVTLPMAWAKTDGYHAENERTVVVGRLEGVRERAYEAMLAAREAVFAILKPGVRFEELYFAAVKEFEKAGFGDILPGRVGHGVGNSAHEFPSLAKGNQIPLAPGMVVTVEPGLMDKRWGGARHSDTVLVTEKGYEKLTKLRSDRIVIEK